MTKDVSEFHTQVRKTKRLSTSVTAAHVTLILANTLITVLYYNIFLENAKIALRLSSV